MSISNLLFWKTIEIDLVNMIKDDYVFILTYSKQNAEEKMELESHKDLKPMGLYIQTRLRVLICTTCKCALLPTSVVRHFSEHHKKIGVRITKEKLQEIAEQWDLAVQLPTIKIPGLFYRGLPIISNCIKCPFCPNVYGQASLHTHSSVKHPGLPPPNFKNLPRISCQRLNNGLNNSLFEVFVPSTGPNPQPSNTTIDHLRMSRDNLLAANHPVVLDARALSSWMKFTGWHSHVAPCHTGELMSLVAMPHRDEPTLKYLEKVVTEIFDAGYRYIGKTNTIVLQKLKTDDLMGKYVIHKIHEYLSTVLLKAK